MPVLVAAIVAVVGQTVILFNDFGAGNDSQGRSNARMTAVKITRRRSSGTRHAFVSQLNT